MASELLFYRDSGTAVAVLLESGEPVERMAERDPDVAGPGRMDVVLGRVGRAVPALAAVFVDIGSDHPAMLPIRSAFPGEKPVLGAALPVQVVRLRPDGKGPLVREAIRLPGAWAVFDSEGAHRSRTRLKALPADEAAVLREQDLARLGAQWDAIRAEAARPGRVPRPLARFSDFPKAALLDLVPADIAAIRVDGLEGTDLFDDVYREVSVLAPRWLPLVRLFPETGGHGLAAAYGLRDLEERIHRRTVRLPSGGSLVFDRTEAMTVIDVNTGRDVRGADADDLALRTDLEAVAEIARQVRLRNLSGIVVADLVNLRLADHREQVTAALKKAVARDRGRTRVEGLTRLGLMEMTRTGT